MTKKYSRVKRSDYNCDTNPAIHNCWHSEMNAVNIAMQDKFTVMLLNNKLWKCLYDNSDQLIWFHYGYDVKRPYVVGVNLRQQVWYDFTVAFRTSPDLEEHKL